MAPPVHGHDRAGVSDLTDYRILTNEGRISPGFRWTDPSDARDPVNLLRAEGVAIVNGKADPSRTLITDDLVALLEG